MVEYNPKILQKFAHRLYSRASGIIVSWTCIGIILGLVTAAYFTRDALERGYDPRMPRLIGGLVGAGIGLWFGTSRAFHLKLMAQEALCQMQIEADTRPAKP